MTLSSTFRILSLMAASAIALSLPAAAENTTFNKPKINGYRLDWCKKWGDQCGKPAADAFCKLHEFQSAISFVNDPAPGAPTKVFSGGQLCEDDSCNGFKSITCKSNETLIDDYDGEGSQVEPPASDAEADVNILNKLGGQVQGELSSVAFSDGNKQRVAVFARGMDNALWWQAGNGEGKWYGWASIGGQMKGSPSCTPYKGKVYCAVRGMDDGVWVTQWSGGKWSGFTNLGGKTKSSPAMVHGYGAVHALVRGLDGNLFDNAFVEDPETELSNWTGWKSTGMSINGAPTCIVSKADKIHCYYRNADGATHEMVDVLNGGPTKNLGGETAVRPGVLGQNAASNIRVLVKGMDEKLWVNRRSTSGKWGGFKQTEYTFSGQPVCVDSNAEGIGVWCFATGGDKSVFAQRLPIEAFSGQ